MCHMERKKRWVHIRRGALASNSSHAHAQNNPITWRHVRSFVFSMLARPGRAFLPSQPVGSEHLFAASEAGATHRTERPRFNVLIHARSPSVFCLAVCHPSGRPVSPFKICTSRAQREGSTWIAMSLWQSQKLNVRFSMYMQSWPLRW